MHSNKHGVFHENRSKRIEKGERSVSENSVLGDYHEDTGDSDSVYRYLETTGDYEHYGITDQEMNNFNNNNNIETPNSERDLSYSRAKQKLNRNCDKIRGESNEGLENETEIENHYDVPRTQGKAKIGEVEAASPPKAKPRTNNQGYVSRPRSKSMQTLEIPHDVPLPKPRKISQDNYQGRRFPSPREQVLKDVRGRSPRVSDIAEAISRSRSPSPSPPTAREISSSGRNDENWLLRRQLCHDTSISASTQKIRTERLENDGIVDSDEEKAQEIYDDRNKNPNLIRKKSFSFNPTQEEGKEKDTLERKVSLAEEWVESLLNNFESPIDVTKNEEEHELDFDRRSSTLETGRSRLSVSSTAGTAISGKSIPASDKNYDLTVAPIEEEPEEENVNESCGNFYLIVIKWIAAIFVALVVLSCVTINKICLLAIGKEHSMPKDMTSLDKTGRKESISLMLIIILMVPQAFSLIAAIWSKRKSQPWPCKKSVLWIIFGGIIEVCCLGYLCIYAVTVVHHYPHIFLLFTSGLFLVPTVIQVYESRKNISTSNGKYRTGLFIVAAIFQIGGLTTLFFMDGLPATHDMVGIPIAIILLSTAWSPKVRRLQTQSSIQIQKTNSANTPKQASQPFERFNFDNVSMFSKQDETDDPIVSTRSAREKAALVMSFVKVLATPAVSAIICLIFKLGNVDNIKEGFGYITPDHPVFYHFLVQIFATLFGYHFAWLACSMYTQRLAFALPLTLATPLALIFVEVDSLCNTSVASLICGPQKGKDLYLMIGAAILLLVGQFLSTGYYVWANKGYIMGKASHLFWLPSYTGALLEPFLLLNRRNKVTDDSHVSSKQLTRKTYVFICSTMYHEELYEMEQLLESIHDVDNNIQKAKRHVESHIFFDGAIKAEVLNEYVLQLATIVRKTLKVELNRARKIRTPYGMQLQWILPGGLPITIHLKDNSRVKNKKRWSQVMYMSYVLDYKQRLLQVNDDQSFILTTDADVNFTHDSVEALIDYMVQDEKIGAVCGRTHPMGNGPLVWYQTFDYAVGHWFAKVANHVFGSVLCCPGCFSLYRCRAVRSVLREYSTNVNEAFEFLTKDMGEDRWFCTLMVENGWRLAYCAAAEDKTYCPQEFEEFYKQRRRWMPSTLANLALLVSKWRMVLKNNENISFAFILFQIVLLLATLIGPSIVILFIVGGLVSLSTAANEDVIVILFSVLTIAYGVICLFFSQNIQIKLAKFLTFVFAVIMLLVTIGLCTQIEQEVRERRTLNITEDSPLIQRLPAGVSTLYLSFLVAIFVFTALLHPKEFLSLIHGFWYLLCLPSGYLLLTIYSIVNMTDRSWGTREGKTASTANSQNENPITSLWSVFKLRCSCFLTCCQREQNPKEQASSKNKRDTVKHRITRGSIYRPNASSRKGSKVDSDTDSEVASNSSKRRGNRRQPKIQSGTLKRIKAIMKEQHIDSESEGSDSTASMSRPKRKKSRDPSVGTLRRIRDYLWNVESERREPEGRRESSRKPTITVNVGPIDYDEDELPKSDLFGSLGNEAYHPDDDRPTAIQRQFPRVIDMENSSDSAYNSDKSLLRQKDASRTIERLKSFDGPRRKSAYDDDAASHTTMDDLITLDINLEMTVDEWLKGDLRPYVDNFQSHGYDTLAFITGMSSQDLESIGVKINGHRSKLHRAIVKFPPLVIEEGIPADVRLWLDDLGLGEYWPNFVDNGCTESCDLEDLKKMSKENLKNEYKVKKIAHINMLYKAIQKLKYARQDQKQIAVARRELESLPTETLEPVNENDPANEFRFWETLRQQCLLPESAIFTDNAELKQKLAELRNSVVMIFFVANALWMVVIMVLVKQTRLKTLGVDILGLSFLLIYGLITFFQFLAMIYHRLTTLLHILARTPWVCCGKQTKTRFDDNVTTITRR